MDESMKKSIIDMYKSYKTYKDTLKTNLNKKFELQRKFLPDIKDIDKIKAEHFDPELHVLLLRLLKRLEFIKEQLQIDLNTHVEKMLTAMPKKTDEDIDDFERLMDKYFNYSKALSTNSPNGQIVGGSITKKNRKSKKKKKRKGTKKRR